MSTKVIPLISGLSIAGTSHKTVELREPLLEDYCEAEKDAPVYHTVAYRRALVARLIVCAGDYKDMVTPAMLGKLRGVDWNRLSTALQELEREGEDTASDGTGS